MEAAFVSGFEKMKKHLACLLLFGFGVSSVFAAKQLTGQHAPATSPALSPADAQKAFSVPPGFEARLFAAEPDVVNPVAMTFDERGRLWVLELYEYPLGAPAGQKGRDRIKILEDTDNDGKADKVTLFADGLNLATGLLVGNGGVYVGQAPHLLFLQDTNHDDKADVRTVVLTGFGLHDRHELLNGFTWGPDGWLYMTHGVFTASKVKIPEATTPGVEMNAAVARFHPRTKKFEIFADGTSNPWGVDFDKNGNAFVSACVIDHLFHMAPGGIYQRQGGVPGNPYAYELLPSIVEHKHHMAAYCGICIYQGDNFPAEYQDRVFMGNIHQNAINHDRLIPNGSSFKAVAEKDFLTTTDGWFRPVSEQVGPDGALWIADWYDKYPCYQNAQADPEGVDRERGRIWRVVYVGDRGKKVPTRPDVNMDLSKLDNKELIALLGHSNVWQRRVASRILREHVDYTPAFPDKYGFTVTRGAEGLKPLELQIHSSDMDGRLNSFWTLKGIGSFFTMRDNAGESWPDVVEKYLDDKDPVIRCWAINFSGEIIRRMEEMLKRSSPNQQSLREFIERTIAHLETLAADSDPRVRLAVATAVREIVSSSLTIDTDINTEAPVGKILVALIRSSADAKDPLIPYMIWMASEPLVANNPVPGLRWAAENGANTMPLSGILARKAMRRICDTGESTKMDAAAEFLSAIVDKEELAIATLDGLIEGQKAKPLRPTTDTKPVLERLLASSSQRIKDRAQQLGTLWGDAAAAEKTLAVINDAKSSTEERMKAIQSAKQMKSGSARDALLKLILSNSPEPLIIEGVQSLGAIADEASSKEIVKNWKTFSPNVRRIAAEVLVSRSQSTRQLLDALEDKVIAPSELSATVARALFTSKNPNFVGRAERLLGKFRESDPDKLKVIAEKKKLVVAGEPNIEHGHEIAKKTCFVCHKLHGEGAEVGPDLTGVGRSTLDALLANVIDPNQIIGKGYELVEVELKDGRTVSGRVVEESDARIKLIAAGPTENVVAKSDIESKRVSQLSVMPEGLEQMPENDFRDLVWFILSPPQEGPLTAEKRKALSGR